MDQFYVTLPSDSSMDFYPDNTVANFTTRLASRIHLEQNYDVGLSEIIYPFSWFNFNNENKGLRVRFDETELVFDSGQFTSEVELTKYLNNQMLVANIDAKFKWNGVRRKMRLTVENGQLYLSEGLMILFGFKKEGPYASGVWNAELSFNLNDGTDLIYVYCDIASYTTVGHTEAPLLRVCNTIGSYGDMVRHIFTHPHYVPVSRCDFETIEININNEHGKPMPFQFGKSMVKLHFRR